MEQFYTLPEQFTEAVRRDLPDEAGALLASLDGDSPVSIRFNPYKLGAKPEGSGVPWNRYGFYLDERPQFTIDPLFHAGIYYVQEASSMFVEELVRQWAKGETEDEADVSSLGLRALDMCAAPGGKATLLSTLVGIEGLVVANEPVKQRATVLSENAVKWGLGNMAVTCNDPSHFAQFEGYFDVVLVDAPCSGEGMFRKTPEARGEWSPDNVNLCAARQRKILADAWKALRPGGLLIYSTCTFNRKENEDNVAWMKEEFECEGLNYSPDGLWGIATTDTGGVTSYRFFPHRLRGEGFFASAMVKTSNDRRRKTIVPRKSPFADVSKSEAAELSRWVAQPEYMTFRKVGDNIYGYYKASFPQIKEISESLNVIYSGVCMGQIFKGALRPDHALALFHDLNPEATSAAELDLLQALNYLRRGEVEASGLEQGFNNIRYEGASIGWAKRIDNRVNNLYPKELRIQNL